MKSKDFFVKNIYLKFQCNSLRNVEVFATLNDDIIFSAMPETKFKGTKLRNAWIIGHVYSSW